MDTKNILQMQLVQMSAIQNEGSSFLVSPKIEVYNEMVDANNVTTISVVDLIQSQIKALDEVQKRRKYLLTEVSSFIIKS